MMLEVSILVYMLHQWKATQHPVVLLTVSGGTLAFNFLLEFGFNYLILVLHFLILDHFIYHVCGIPYCCFSICISLLLFLSLCSFWLSFLLFLFPFSSHTLPVFLQNPAFLLSFPHVHLILLRYLTVISAKALFMTFHFPSWTPSHKSQFLQQELWQEISITLIISCTVELRRDPK